MEIISALISFEKSVDLFDPTWIHSVVIGYGVFQGSESHGGTHVQVRPTTAPSLAVETLRHTPQTCIQQQTSSVIITG